MFNGIFKLGDKVVDLFNWTVTVHAKVRQFEKGPQITLEQVFEFGELVGDLDVTLFPLAHEGLAKILCWAQQTQTINAANRIRKNWEDYSDGGRAVFNVASQISSNALPIEEHLRRAAGKALGNAKVAMDHPLVQAMIESTREHTA